MTQQENTSVDEGTVQPSYETTPEVADRPVDQQPAADQPAADQPADQRGAANVEGQGTPTAVAQDQADQGTAEEAAPGTAGAKQDIVSGIGPVDRSDLPAPSEE